ncbi:hypothetical protein WMY93_024742 [Mugilogobius chulae]|uniref:C2H2-type domain-containing protein n=1 Tax=Mugilogobius chulae TaxID=88201 RepID=A0AAW0NBG9_9GOBI
MAKKSEYLRALVSERLTAVAEEIFALFESTIAEYEEELCRFKEENQRKQQLLDAQLQKDEKQDVPTLQTLLDQGNTHFSDSSETVAQKPELDLMSVKSEQSDQTDNSDEWVPTAGPSVKKEEPDETETSREDGASRVEHQCCICDQTFINPQILKRHMDVHMDDARRINRTKRNEEKKRIRCHAHNRRHFHCHAHRLTGHNHLSAVHSANGASPESPTCSVQLQVQSLCLDEGLPDLHQKQEKHDENVEFQIENDNPPPDYPQIVKCEIDQLLSESDDRDEEDLEACSSSAQHLKTEADEELYNQPYAEDSDRTLNSQFEFENFPAEASNTSFSNRQDKLKKHTCYFCQMKFKDRHSLNRHTVVHTGEKPFQCPVCAKCYSYKETLTSHMALHGSSKKPSEKGTRSKAALYTCPICMKSVTTSFALRSHVLLHTGEKPYSCPVCNKAFSQKVYVRKHMRTHTGEKPFSCSECGMRFSRKSNLNRHLKVHAAHKSDEKKIAFDNHF